MILIFHVQFPLFDFVWWITPFFCQTLYLKRQFRLSCQIYISNPILIQVKYMFCILPVAPIRDKVTLSPVGSASSLAPQMDPHRAELRKLSDIDYLLGRLQDGEVLMAKKVGFDNYLSSHVDLMKAYVSTYTPCNFQYVSFFMGNEINTTGLGPRDQWALEIVMSRLNLSSIYHAGAYNSMRTIFTETANSYLEGAKMLPQLVTTIQVTYQYFNEGYQPLKRLLPYFDAIQSLASPGSKSNFLELNHKMFEVYTLMVSCNVAYLKIEKMRQLRQYKKCKEAAFAVYLRMRDNSSRLNSMGVSGGQIGEMSDFFDLGQIFYQVLAYYFMLLQHEESKHSQEYGFVKKEFQQMIADNVVVCDEAERLISSAKTRLRQENDNVIFAIGVMNVISGQIKKFKYRYGINVHQNRSDQPKLQNVIGRRIGASNIWESLDYY